MERFEIGYFTNWTQINLHPLILYVLSRDSTYYLSKGRQYIVQDLLAS